MLYSWSLLAICFIFSLSFLKCTCFCAVLVFTAQQGESAVHARISPLFWTLPFRAPWSTEQSSVGTGNPHYLSILCTVSIVCTRQPQSHSSSPPPHLSPWVSIHLFKICLMITALLSCVRIQVAYVSSRCVFILKT